MAGPHITVAARGAAPAVVDPQQRFHPIDARPAVHLCADRADQPAGLRAQAPNAISVT